jgi:hypothetical protein
MTNIFKFRHNVEALQWLLASERHKVTEWLDAKGINNEETSHKVLHLRDSHGVPTSVFDSEWIVILDDGELKIYSDVDFQERFEIVALMPALAVFERS